MKHLIIILFTLAITGCATNSRETQIQTAINLTPEHFKKTATVKDDSLDTIATITTVNGFQAKRGLFGIVWDDNFLRAHINKKTGHTSFQLYQSIYYRGSGWNFYKAANFETPSGPKSVSATIISQDVDCKNSRYNGCTYNEHVAFDVDESLLRIIASKYSPGQRAGWKFKFTAKSGKDYNDGMLAAEVGGLLEKIDEYRTSHGFSSTK